MIGIEEVLEFRIASGDSTTVSSTASISSSRSARTRASVGSPSLPKLRFHLVSRPGADDEAAA